MYNEEDDDDDDDDDDDVLDAREVSASNAQWFTHTGLFCGDIVLRPTLSTWSYIQPTTHIL
jgi:hypothetical protein